MFDMAYDIRNIAAAIEAMKPKTVFNMKDVIDTQDPTANKLTGKQFKEDVELGLTKAVPIGKDSANREWYVRKP